MLTNKIYKYFSWEIFKTFLIILFAFTSIAWTVRSVSFLDLIIEDGYSTQTYALFSLLNISNIITKFIPLSFLISLVISILKFQRQSELLVLWTSGVNKKSIVNLFFFIAVIILFIQLFLATLVTPYALNKSRNIIKTSSMDSLSSIIKSNDFTDTFSDLTFYVEKKNLNNEMENIFIRDESNVFKDITSSPQESVNTTILANKGIFINKKLTLFDGLIQTQDLNGKIENIRFEKTELSLESLHTRTTKVPKIQETATSYLFKCLKRKSFVNEEKLKCTKKETNMEHISRRVGMPLYIPLISLICSFLLITAKRKKNIFLKKYTYFLISFIILVLAELLVRYSGFSNTNTILYFLIPILLLPFVYFILLNKITNEKLR